MKSLVDRARRQTAVYWGRAILPVDDYGQPAFADPIELTVRWEETNDEFISPQGTREVSAVKCLVGQDVEVGGLLMLGELVTAEDSGFPSNPKDGGALEIRQFQKVPSLKGNRTMRMAIL